MMQNHFYRTLLIYSVIVLSAILIYPTLGWMTLTPAERDAQLLQWDEEDNEWRKEKHSFSERVTKSVRRWSEFDRSRVINLGLDLQGGLHMVLGFEMTPEATERGLDEAAIQEIVLQNVRNRINDFEVREPVIQKLGKNQVQIQLPGVKNVQRAKDLIMKTAFLGFHMVSEPEETLRTWRAVDEYSGNDFVPYLDVPFSRGGPFQVSEEHFNHIKDIVQRAEAAGILPEGKTVAFSPPPLAWEDRGYEIYLMDAKELMSGEGLKSASAVPDSQSPGVWMILFEFDTDASREFADLTESNVGRDMAIVLDGKVVSAPTINERIFGGGQISGSFTAEESKDLEIALNSGSMPVPVREDYTAVVGPTLGADSVTKGVRSSIIGLLLVMVFMFVYYRVGGLVANIALTVNALLILGAFAYFGATLTLPGIAGLILTIGMAVDANVLIFERIREELRNGKSLASAVEGGYERATTTILDANITTLIAAAVLTQFGSGPVQGFAVALSIGVCSSVFCALVVTRALLDFMTERNLMKKFAMMSVFKAEPKFKFLGKRKVSAVVSVIVIAVGVITFIYRGQDNFGVDFTSGTNMIVQLEAYDVLEVGEIRERLTDAGFDSPTVQEYQAAGADIPNQFVIRVGQVVASVSAPGAQEAEGEIVEPKVFGTVSTRVQQALLPMCAEPAGDADEQVQLLSVQTVGPQVGKRLRRDAVLALSYALLFIVAYLWFRFELKFAVGAVVALVHDVLVVIGLFAMTGREITIPFVAALLTIIGYSLNDTIVVFDRIRENLAKHRTRGLQFTDILDSSINQTLSRTLLTSVTTFCVVFVLFLFGGNAINDFALALMAGVIVGTYSSIFVAAPVVLLWERLWGRRNTSGDGEAAGRYTRNKKTAPKTA
ncbi:MAG: protein translocase subunit SecD [Candidatus Hydrogenedentes bacterium]|nr:protein translocase subunit SecD [Candidatus Hydrogenedentota bacterium]